MAQPIRRFSTVNARADGAVYDAGLRAFMLGVYNHMAAGIG